MYKRSGEGTSQKPHCSLNFSLSLSSSSFPLRHTICIKLPHAKVQRGLPIQIVPHFFQLSSRVGIVLLSAPAPLIRVNSSWLYLFCEPMERTTLTSHLLAAYEDCGKGMTSCTLSRPWAEALHSAACSATNTWPGNDFSFRVTVIDSRSHDTDTADRFWVTNMIQ